MFNLENVSSKVGIENEKLSIKASIRVYSIAYQIEIIQY